MVTESTFSFTPSHVLLQPPNAHNIMDWTMFSGPGNSSQSSPLGGGRPSTSAVAVASFSLQQQEAGVRKLGRKDTGPRILLCNGGGLNPDLFPDLTQIDGFIFKSVILKIYQI